MQKAGFSEPAFFLDKCGAGALARQRCPFVIPDRLEASRASAGAALGCPAERSSAAAKACTLRRSTTPANPLLLELVHRATR